MNCRLFHLIVFVLLCCCPVHAQPPDSLLSFPMSILRLRAFGECIPQEKVYVHLDNRCYFIGDTIWFKAYTQQTNNSRLSEVSGTLYVELFDQEGYLKERKLVEMKHGQGRGFFATDSLAHSGFYELRAYTRWQLNWGEFAHKHRPQAEKWFFNKAMSHEYFRDYEKLYSRTFPIFDRQQVSGGYYLDITPRPAYRASFTTEPKATPSVRFYPEGGNLVEGLPCRVAYEAVMSNGEYMEGSLVVGTDTIPVVNRGRGMFTLTPSREGGLPKTVFLSADTTKVKCRLPKAEKEGVSLRVEREADNWVVETRMVSGEMLTGQCYLTVMHQGVLQHAWLMKGGHFRTALPVDSLPVGVNQVTVSDSAGRVWADRLFFVNQKELSTPTVTVGGVPDELVSYQPVTLSLQAQTKESATVSVAVRDAYRQHGNFDNTSILAEMLLCSEIRGFVPRPDYFFEKDDAEHHTALDLLMMTQGWRRFDWREMAMRGEFEFLHPAERTPVLTGVAHKYRAMQKYDPTQYGTRYYEHLIQFGMMDKQEFLMDMETVSDRHNLFDKRGTRRKTYKLPKDKTWAIAVGATDSLKWRLVRDGEKLRREAKVHAEFIIDGCDSMVVGEATTYMGRFRINTPRFQGKCHFHLAASDTTKWTRKEKKENFHLWVFSNESEYPEFLVRLSYPYPMFVKPLNSYQASVGLTGQPQEDTLFFPKDVIQLKEVNVEKQRRSGLVRRRYEEPVMALDVYDAFNQASDAGLIDPWFSSTGDLAVGIARYLCADMGINERYKVIDQLGNELDLQNELFQIDGKNPDKARKEYNYLYNLDSIYVYTGYSPRMEGDKRYMGADVPMVRVRFKKRDISQNMRATYRDRYITLSGYAYLADFYHPDYSTRQPSPEDADYRRTLYWNPDLKLDSTGRAEVKFFNSFRTTRLSIDVAGLSEEGKILWNRTE